jgi:hypothetical protein
MPDLLTFEARFSSDHSPDELWQGINTPLSAELGRLVQPEFVVLKYGQLSDEGQIQLGTSMVYTADRTAINSPEGLAMMGMLAEGVRFRVEEHDPGDRVRTDVVEPDQIAQGSIRRQVENKDGRGVLAVEVEISPNGRKASMLAAISGPALESVASIVVGRAVYEPSQRTIENLPRILES